MNQQESVELPAWLPASKKSAFFGHLLLSIVIFLLLAGVIYFYWFPGGLFAAAGGWEGIRIVAGVDLVLGPLLMVVIYNVSKKPLLIVIDVIIVLVIQLSCLGAGVYIVYQERPAAVVFIGGDPLIKKRKELESYKNSEGIVEKLTLHSPSFYYLNIPKTELDDFLLLIGRQFDVLAAKTQYYESLPTDQKRLRKVLGRELKECVEVQIVSAYSEGKICFNPSDFSFGNFKKAQEKFSEKKSN